MREISAKALEAEILAQDLMQFAERLRAEGAGHSDTPLDDEGLKKRATRSHLAMARAFYRERRLRDQFLPTDLFGEPAWDMLLDLYVALVEARDISVTSLCGASCVPQTTALRWISILEERGLIRRFDSPHDARVSIIELSDEGARGVQRYLWRVASESGEDATAFLLRTK